MSKIVVFAGMAILSTLSASPQSTTRPTYMERAAVEHKGPTVEITSNDANPLAQAIQGLREEYGWRVNYEGAPLYSQFDVVDDTDPKSREAHPGERGVTRPVGGKFTTTLTEITDPTRTEGVEAALTKLVEDYNRSPNPGRYVLRRDTDGQLTIIGIRVRDDSGGYQTIVPVLDTPIIVSKQRRTVYEAVHAITDALSRKVGTQVILMSFPNNEFDKEVTLGGEETPARDLLKQAFSATNRPTLYDLGYDADVPVYGLNVSVAMKAHNDGAGHRKLVAIDSPLNR